MNYHSFGSVDPVTEQNACCATDKNAITSATQHAVSAAGGSAKQNECCVADAFDSTEPPQRCARVRMSGFLFPDNQLRQNARLSLSTTYILSLAAGPESEKCGWGRVFEPPATCQ